MRKDKRLKENILVWGIFSLVYLGTVNTVFAGSANSSFYSAVAAIIPAFIVDRYLRSRASKEKPIGRPAGNHETGSKRNGKKRQKRKTQRKS